MHTNYSYEIVVLFDWKKITSVVREIGAPRLNRSPTKDSWYSPQYDLLL